MGCLSVRLWCAVSPHEEPCYVDYGGPWPSSELETQAVTSFIRQRQDSLAALINVHSYGQFIMTRWAYTDQLYPPEHNETVSQFGRLHMQGRIQALQ